MSKPNSLFAKNHIEKEKFESFLSEKPTAPTLNNDWSDWWNSREMYSKTDLDENRLSCYSEPTNELIIKGWENEESSFTFSDYDSENEIWHFGIIMFSENYYEMIPGLAFIKSVATYKKENIEDFAIIYNYFWGDQDVCAFVTYEDGKSAFNKNILSKSDLNLSQLEYSDNYLTKKWDEFAESGKIDEYD